MLYGLYVSVPKILQSITLSRDALYTPHRPTAVFPAERELHKPTNTTGSTDIGTPILVVTQLVAWQALLGTQAQGTSWITWSSFSL